MLDTLVPDSALINFFSAFPILDLLFISVIKMILCFDSLKVYTKGILLFTEVESSLKKIKSQFEGLTLNLRGSLKEFSDIEDMLKQERSEFEVSTFMLSYFVILIDLDSGCFLLSLILLLRLFFQKPVKSRFIFLCLCVSRYEDCL